ncbi:hypothetical protein HAX54_014724 [Datura stramonium]|uniref:Outer envelope membrane protein 7 n=1 Tax=Datura stramonium TaxID=4076 RepID=A0ABS8S1A4_DATST|nr:hypothetical protein [Datura stramonium]
MGAVTTALIAIAGVILGWITIEIACKPCLEKGRDAIDRNLDPDYDPDDQDNNIRAPLNPNPNPSKDSDSTVAPVVKRYKLESFAYCSRHFPEDGASLGRDPTRSPREF